MIPKIFHFIWLQGDPPAEMQANIAVVKDLHPTWEFKLWSEANLHPLVHESEYALAASASSKSNIVRLEKVFEHGGVYCDTDVVALKPFDDLLSHKAFCAWEEVNVRVGSAVFGAMPRSPWLQLQLDLLHSFAARPAPWGPHLMTEACWQLPSYVSTFPPVTFYPYLWYQRHKVDSRSYAEHQWKGSWK